VRKEISAHKNKPILIFTQKKPRKQGEVKE
jgi:hypothetical protein